MFELETSPVKARGANVPRCVPAPLFLKVFTLMMTSWVLAGPTLASCKWQPPAGELATIPANGTQAAPVDSKLWILIGDGTAATVSFEGVELPVGTKETTAWSTWELPELHPGKEYSFSVNLCHAAGCQEEFTRGPYSFVVGSEFGTPPSGPEIVMAAAEEWGPFDENFETGSCKAYIAEQDCYDTGDPDFFTVLIEGITGSHYSIRATWKDTGGAATDEYLMPSDCPAYIVTGTGGVEIDELGNPIQKTLCFHIVPYNTAGTAGKEVVFCGGGKPTDDEVSADNIFTRMMDDGQPSDKTKVEESENESAESCSVSWHSDGAIVFPLLFMLVGLVLTVIARRRGQALKCTRNR